MTSHVFGNNHVDLDVMHRDSILASLEHRLTVAKSKDDSRLVELLEQERRQIEADGRSQSLLPALTFLSTGIAKLKTLWQVVTESAKHSADLQVWQSSDRNGNMWWFAYDPKTGRSTCAESESDMRVWIEENYQE